VEKTPAAAAADSQLPNRCAILKSSTPLRIRRLDSAAAGQSDGDVSSGSGLPITADCRLTAV